MTKQVAARLTFLVGLVVAFALVALSITNAVSGRTATFLVLLAAACQMLSLALQGGRRALLGVIVVMLVAVVPTGASLAPAKAAGGFYDAAAQVIPVLLLVLAFEARVFRLRALARPLRSAEEGGFAGFSRRVDADLPIVIAWGVTSVALAVMVFGELEALGALAGTHPERANPRPVYGAIFVGLVTIAFLALFGPPEDRAPTSSQPTASSAKRVKTETSTAPGRRREEAPRGQRL